MLNRLGYSGQRLRCRLRNSLALRQRRLRTLRLYPSLDAHPLRPFIESYTFSWDGRYRLLLCDPASSAGTGLSPCPALGRKRTVGIGQPKRAVRLYFRPKLVSVKRRDRSERPERLLFERSEFQTRQRTKGTE